MKRMKRYGAGKFLKFLLLTLPCNQFGDAFFATVIHLLVHKRWPNNPELFSDYLWRMKAKGELYDPLRQLISDKELVKLYVKAIVGDSYNIPNYAVLGTEEELMAYDFPENCVIKPTHASGKVAIRLDDSPVDVNSIAAFFSLDLYKKSRQMNYRYLNPKIIVEALALGLHRPTDYRLFCYNGIPKFFMLDSKDEKGRWQTFVDTDWRPCGFRISLPPHKEPIERPDCLDEMLEIARNLAKPFGFIRIDFYTENSRFVIGELTNCHASGAARFATRADEEAFSRALFG